MAGSSSERRAITNDEVLTAVEATAAEIEAKLRTPRKEV